MFICSGMALVVARLLVLLSMSVRAALVNGAPSAMNMYSTATGSQLRFSGHHNRPQPFNPLEHMSGISPYHDAPGANLEPPEGCKVSAAAFLIRHSAVYANDDEWDDFMKPTVDKIYAARKSLRALDHKNPLRFLGKWKVPIEEDQVEMLTEPGRKDAFGLGKRMRYLYGPLMPPKHYGKKEKSGSKGKKGDKVEEPFKIFTASSERDIESSKAWIRGAFPNHQEGDDGEGDGKFVSLVKVPNKSPDWASSLTPHKLCPAFTKEVGKPEAQIWLETYGPEPLKRLQEWAPEVGFALNDIIGLQMLCGYESVILKSRSSRFCSSELFTEYEFRSFGYWNDIKYHYQVGYGARFAPHLGMPWVNVSTHNLIAAFQGPHPHLTSGSKLPPPSAPPDEEHTQLLFPYFSHREEPAVVLVALGLWNTTTIDPHRLDHDRAWHTSHLLPFLGHIALERLSCKGDDTDYMRILVNGAPQKVPACHHGRGGSCPLDEWAEYVQERQELYIDFEGACKKD
ncbi:hypothetical protein MVLG_02088 [Microbotryum lychnidis-dioicae p1A1 Lamole]|uniref:Acid phosphatase n=1 Tax=Microbotryum lychnidis-dioicae (strain p1A1 Lamole / MvSl-1064) TaxID=683840 RepID=U5H440_USTV1|nr:hypothetical protein MVLG_02088 [Microbotryum lychnidis-dioicae p1A1 Lamole]|eukprot:KDE07625.1 hypothetical protein MVLG_02088 [Microbotryum lychnidis-dioicae p1A1 Lamole]